MKNKKLYIILSVAVLSVVMTLVDGVLTPPYAVKSAVKLVLFAGVPLIYYLTDRKERAVLKKSSKRTRLLKKSIITNI